MAESIHLEFDMWLKKKLCDLCVDEDILGPYIIGILESDDPLDEKKEAIFGILGDISEAKLEEICSEIISKWESSISDVSQNGTIEKPDIEDKLAMLMEKSKVVTEVKLVTDEQKQIKQAILAQYRQVSDCEEEEEESNIAMPIRNDNAEKVARAEREKREKDKEAAKNKKEKDKEDRAKQKAKVDDRKDKEKKRTQKGEKRR